MAKLDIKSAHRKVPVHPDNQLPLGTTWEGRTFCDRALPFGLRSALKLFTLWWMACRGPYSVRGL